jgi:uncharacterized protein YkwD
MPALRPIVVCLTLVCVLVFWQTPPEVRASQSPMVDRINAMRAAHGVHALRYSRSLSRSSSSFSRYLLLTGRFAHAGRIVASGRFSMLGEILALSRGWKIRRTRTLRYWLGSPGHRSVLLSSYFSYIGAARVRGFFGGSRVVAWTVQFGR